MSKLTTINTEKFSVERKLISYMTTKSWQRIPHVSYMYEPDVTDFIDEFRKLKAEDDSFKNVSINSLMLKVFSEGLKFAPKLNAHISYNQSTGEGEIRTIKDINVNMPWILPNGKMMTISINNIEEMSLYEINKYIKEDLGQKISNMDSKSLSKSFSDKINFNTIDSIISGERKISEGNNGENKSKLPLEIGTITISNIGSTYRDQRGAITLLDIIPPQVCVIGFGAILEKPGVYIDENGEKAIGIRKTLPICLAFDHRALDFGEIIPFMKKLDSIFENPNILKSF
ncbi:MULTISPECIES: 2-oxo acid dehydrogenase subunit E2 [Clostridium]|uniref:2-oxoacid dehydrogenase acyltransferase catalytic domain-containing protein n=1 Tax=Clostridium nitritogenes TaxID=83340 RepID=A0ABN1LLS5_9CLOT|nr:2-oxo acid dehydrogenase subunit E2 [Clostridium baratii]MBS6043899.1 2-oxo acid dehydrogenase subunit E2 [Clostridium baratii]MBT9832482.1 dihydrolipoamide acetyltransferase [Clostridium baratii]MDY3207786.1 2-oxo acid dehydrogenase subunit E2 [Clostridium baratii]